MVRVVQMMEVETSGFLVNFDKKSKTYSIFQQYLVIFNTGFFDAREVKTHTLNTRL